MKKQRLLLLLASAFMVSGCVEAQTVSQTEKLVDDITYSDPSVKDFSNPDFTRGLSRDGDGDDDEPIGDIKKIVLTYVNDDKDCKNRAFYVWCDNVDGFEFSDATAPGMVTYSTDGTQMSITIDFENAATLDPDEDTNLSKLAAILALEDSRGGVDALKYIIKYKKKSESDLNWGGQSEDVVMDLHEFSPDGSGIVKCWCTPAAGGGIAQFHTEAETQVEGIKLAKFIDWKTIDCTMTKDAYDVDWELYAFDETYYKIKPKKRAAAKHNYLVATGNSKKTRFKLNLKYNAHINVVYSIVSKNKDKNGKVADLEKTIFISFENLYGTKRFEQFYNYSGNDLGVTYAKGESTFKVWSPVAANVTLNIYDKNMAEKVDPVRSWHMSYQPGGVWTLTLKGNLDGKYYNYTVDNWNGSATTMDPYATSCGINGVRGFIYDKNSDLANPTNWDNLPLVWDQTTKFDIDTPQELTIYEVHVQDFTGDESWGGPEEERGTYNGFVRRGTTVTKNGKTVKTGFDHLQELGINAVQLMPVFDSDNDERKDQPTPPKYNWGYNPLNYNCVEGVYSSAPTELNPYSGYTRVREFKNMIYQLSTIGVRTIMDVVYNHVSSPSASCFNKLMPRYYFRYDSKGELYDGSGCHNEFKSEATMARKYIVDSLVMWAKEYKIKGFRFDLMGLIDSLTMKKAKEELYKIDPDIYIYGEGWTAAGFHGGRDATSGEQTRGTMCTGDDPNNTGNCVVYNELYEGPENQQIYLGGFNDSGRNALRGGNDGGWGSTNALPGYGFMQHGISDSNGDTRVELQRMIWGGRVIGANPKQTVNYASCHDNWTLRDQLYYTLGDGSNAGNGYDIMHASEAAHAAVFASNGVAFMLGGEEILRTKDTEFYADYQKEAEKDDFKKLLPNTYEKMYDHYISHNSYNSPIEVNSFKWENKIETVFDNKKGGTKTYVDTYSEGLTAKFAEMIKAHQEMNKYDFGELYGDDTHPVPISQKTRAGEDVGSLSWAGSSECSIGIQLDEYFIFLGGREFGTNGPHSGCGSWTKILSAGVNKIEDNVVHLGGLDYGKGFACLVLKRH